MSFLYFTTIIILNLKVMDLYCLMTLKEKKKRQLNFCSQAKQVCFLLFIIFSTTQLFLRHWIKYYMDFKATNRKFVITCFRNGFWLTIFSSVWHCLSQHLIGKLRKNRLDKWMVRWTENWVNSSSQRVPLSSTGSSWSLSPCKCGIASPLQPLSSKITAPMNFEFFPYSLAVPLVPTCWRSSAEPVIQHRIINFAFTQCSCSKGLPALEFIISHQVKFFLI